MLQDTLRTSAPIDLTGPAGGWTDELRSEWGDVLAASIAGPEAWETSPRTGARPLRTAFAEYLRAPVDQVAVTTGIRGALPGLLSGARRLVVERPGFRSVRRLAVESGVETIALTWEEMFDGGHLDDGTVVWLTSPARNPDGRTLTKAEAARLDMLSARCRAIVVNQAYLWCAPQAPVPREAIRIGSLHKLAGGGVHLGWRISPGGAGPERPACGGPSTAWQLAWAAFIVAGGLDRLARRALREPQRRCHEFVTGLRPPAGVGVSYACGPSLLLEMPASWAEDEAGAAFRAEGLAAGLGAAFDGPRPSLRLCFTGVTDEQVPSAVAAAGRALTRLARF